MGYLNNLSQSNTLYNPIEEMEKNWDDTTRGLTQTGMIAVALVATVATMGAASAVGVAAAGAAGMTATTSAGATVLTIGGTMLSAATSVSITATASTFAVSATNASMNDSGNFFSSLDNVTYIALKETTSEESMKNIAIASTTAAITAGIGSKLGSTTNSATNSTTSSSTAATATSTTANTTNSLTLTQKLSNALQNQAINNTTSSAVQSAINGDSFAESMKNQIQNIIINTIGQVAANEIGNLAHPDPNNPNNLINPLTGETTPKINTITQLTMHAALGAGMAAASGNDALSGAVAGVVGELTAEVGDKNTNLNDSSIVKLSGLAGGFSSIIIGTITNQDDEEIANNISSSNSIAQNAAENNYQSDVHRDLTKFLAENAGFSEQEAQIIADADQGVDENPDTEPLFSGRTSRKDYHFTDQARREDMLDSAIMSNDLESFGQYLHAFQDSFSHQEDGKPFGDMFGHLDLTKLFSGFGDDIDKTYNRPELADEMAAQTYQQMRQFLLIRNNGVPSIDNWNQIQNKVQIFNRLKIENETKKGITLHNNNN